MNCPGCQRNNHPARRYCGGCGCNFEPACADCGFANDTADRFCGGCGQPLRAHRHAGIAAVPRSTALPGTAHTPAPAVPGATAASVWDLHELAELFAPAPIVEESPDLPDVGIGQDDVDKLFGGAS